MKKFSFTVAFAALYLVACNNSDHAADNHQHHADGSHPKIEGRHTHDDGSVHDDREADSSVKQEQFKVGQDSSDHDHADPNHKH